MREARKQSIGVFDSGFGGINILRGIVKELPEYNYLYLGDTARSPYGARSTNVVYEFTKQAVDFLFAHNCELIILACNTASSSALRRIQREYLPKYYPNKKVLGVLIPAAEVAATKTRNKKIAVIATEGTVNSRAFIKEIKKLDRKIYVFQQACPLLVPIVEAGEHKSAVTALILKKYLKIVKAKKVDTLILGCTHYGILEKKIRKIIDPNIAIVSEAIVVPKKLRGYLKKHSAIEKKLRKNGKVMFYTTDLTERFIALGSKFFDKKINAKKAIIK